MKIAGWTTRRVAGQVDRSECAVRNCWEQWTREGTHAWKTGSGVLELNCCNCSIPKCRVRVDRSEWAVKNCWKLWTREGTHARKTGSGATRKTTRREDRRIVRQALVDPTMTRSTIRADVGVAIVPQTISRHLAEGQKMFQQDNARPHTARVAQDFLRHFQTLPWPARFPNLFPVEHVWDQLKRQIPRVTLYMIESWLFKICVPICLRTT
ncbi:transposable element Tcb2 transposase [Trichonephila clavipes]|nr:transposable element Tcb2 transposase [Trichonephila clavipes]